MRTSAGPVGPRGAALLLAAAIVGGVLAVHGWTTRQPGPSLGALGGVSAPASAPTSAAPPAPDPSPGAATTAPKSGGATTGPLLSSQSFASYAYQVWPGSPSATARSAMTGLSISVSRTASGVSVTAGVSGQPGAAHAYAGGAKVYVVEASMGDEAGSSDYNLGDDGVVVTDAHGRIVQ